MSMKKLLIALVVATGLWSCTNEDEPTTGEIYGVVTVKETAEPMRATGVELFVNNNYDYADYYGASDIATNSGNLLLKTVTYDDGHYEFKDLEPGSYTLKVVATGYSDVTYNVEVQSGRTARADMQLERLNTYLTVRTITATDVTGNSATLNGQYSSRAGYAPTSVGFVYSTSPTPSNGGKTITSANDKSFSSTISDLKKGKYYFQAFARNQVGTEYGEVLSFEISGLPAITTSEATNITANTATLSGRIDYEGSPTYTERGFVYSAYYPNPTVEDPASATTRVVVAGKSKEFSANIAGLTENATYYVRAYAKSDEVVYGETVSFKATDYLPYIIIDNLAIQSADLSSGTVRDEAIDLCTQSRVGGFSDWRLPTLGELSLIYANKDKLKGIAQDWYWSTKYSSGWYYAINFETGETNGWSSGKVCRVRAVRTVN